ncbi:MAG: hypothetical protein KF799_13990 [Bdellovibrionales bacterium]|nr:hypothetical protein [Bdellovibrionales bacterium]
MNPSIKLVHSQWSSLDVRGSVLIALSELSPEAQRALYLRFWENDLIEEIAEDLQITWDEADRLIEMALKQMKMRLSEGDIFLQMFQAS